MEDTAHDGATGAPDASAGAAADPAPASDLAPAEAAVAVAVLDPADDLVLAAPPPPHRHPAAVYLANLRSPASRATMRGVLDRLAALAQPGATAATLAWHRLRYAHTAAMLARLAAAHAPATVNKARAALRRVLREARKLGLMESDDYLNAIDVDAVAGEREAAGRALAAAEVRALLAACDRATPRGARDAALLGLLFGGGMRRAEAISVDLAGADLARGRVKVRGKGNRDRVVPLNRSGAALVRAWVAVRGDAPGPLLCPFARDGAMQVGRRLGNSSVYGILKEIAARAGVADVSPHDARRTRITELLDAGGDYGLVQRIAGHKEIGTTRRYDRRSDEAAARFAEGVDSLGVDDGAGEDAP
jgi:site-specific recombinase XerD